MAALSLTTQSRSRGASRANNTHQGIPGGQFAVGLVTGIVLTLAMSAILPRPAPAPAADPAEAEAPAPQPNSEFQFYTLLNEQEVLIPESAIASGSETERTRYWLQAASFKTAEDADQLRAQLLLLNLEAQISPFNLQGTIWHRVVVGPFESRTLMASARQTLIVQNLDPILIPEIVPVAETPN